MTQDQEEYGGNSPKRKPENTDAMDAKELATTNTTVDTPHATFALHTDQGMILFIAPLTQIDPRPLLVKLLQNPTASEIHEKFPLAKTIPR